MNEWKNSIEETRSREIAASTLVIFLSEKELFFFCCLCIILVVAEITVYHLWVVYFVLQVIGVLFLFVNYLLGIVLFVFSVSPFVLHKFTSILCFIKKK